MVARSLCGTFPNVLIGFIAGFTAAAVLFDAAIFIKIQLTIFNGLFAAVLLGGLPIGRAMMQVFFAKQFFHRRNMVPAELRVGMVFLCLAMANELVWRNAMTQIGFLKTFIAAPASVLFMLAQLPLTIRGRIKSDNL